MAFFRTNRKTFLLTDHSAAEAMSTKEGRGRRGIGKGRRGRRGGEEGEGKEGEEGETYLSVTGNTPLFSNDICFP